MLPHFLGSETKGFVGESFLLIGLFHRMIRTWSVELRVFLMESDLGLHPDYEYLRTLTKFVLLDVN